MNGGGRTCQDLGRLVLRNCTTQHIFKKMRIQDIFIVFKVHLYVITCIFFKANNIFVTFVTLNILSWKHR